MEEQTIDAEEQALRELGRTQDQAEGRPIESEGTRTPDLPVPPAEETQPPLERPQPPDSEPEPTPPTPEEPQQVAARERDDKGRFKSAEPRDNGEQPPPP